MREGSKKRKDVLELLGKRKRKYWRREKEIPLKSSCRSPVSMSCLSRYLRQLKIFKTVYKKHTLLKIVKGIQ